MQLDFLDAAQGWVFIRVAGEPVTQGSKVLMPARMKGRKLIPARMVEYANIVRKNSKGEVTRPGGALKRWRESIAFTAKQVMQQEEAELLHGDVGCCLVFHLPPRSYRLDVDKLTRAVLDALTGVAYKDDSQVSIISARKVKVTAEQPPGVWVSWGAV